MVLLVTVTRYPLLVTGYNSPKTPPPRGVSSPLHGPRLVKASWFFRGLRKIDEKNSEGVKRNLKIKSAGLGRYGDERGSWSAGRGGGGEL